MKRFKTITGIILGMAIAASAATALAFDKPVKTAARDSLAARGMLFTKNQPAPKSCG